MKFKYEIIECYYDGCRRIKDEDMDYIIKGGWEIIYIHFYKETGYIIQLKKWEL